MLCLCDVFLRRLVTFWENRRELALRQLGRKPATPKLQWRVFYAAILWFLWLLILLMICQNIINAILFFINRLQWRKIIVKHNSVLCFSFMKNDLMLKLWVPHVVHKFIINDFASSATKVHVSNSVVVRLKFLCPNHKLSIIHGSVIWHGLHRLTKKVL